MQNSCDLLIMNASAVIPRVGIVDVRGKYVLPGAIDPHVHYGVYTPINEAARTESRSAAVGGVTTMIRMLRLYDSYCNSNISKQLRASKGNHYVDYSIHASILR